MDLPIDHCRLLGVSPSATADAIFRALQLRLDHCPNQGFTREALNQRGELLRKSADLLSRLSSCHCACEMWPPNFGYYHHAAKSGFYVPAEQEIGGLILLWEAHAPQEALRLAVRVLGSFKTPPTESDQVADLALLVALACRDAAREKAERHCYDMASNLLQDGLRLLRCVGRPIKCCQLLDQELELLRPYQILDLLSCNPNDHLAHDKGLALLKALIYDYNGGAAEEKPRDSSTLDHQEFKLFFQQIRRFLTIQEHINLFQHHYEASAHTGFPAVLALTASGFSRRKPEQLTEALELIHLQAKDGHDALPLIGCLQLLLGDVLEAETSFFSSNDSDLRHWLQEYPNDSLAAMCGYCHSWLSTYVLSGFQDTRAVSVDLEAWFADSDVQAYVNSLDRYPKQSEDQHDYSSTLSIPLKGTLDTVSSKLRVAETKIGSGVRKRQQLLSMVAVVLALSTFGIVGLWLRMTRLDRSTSSSYNSEPLILGKSKDSRSVADSRTGTAIPLIFPPIKPLMADNPSKSQLSHLLQGWLDGKAAILAGLKDDRLAIVAWPALVTSVKDQRGRDATANQSQRIKASINSLEIISRTPLRIEVRAVVDYSDQRLASNGRVLEATPPTTLNLRYILGRNGNLWQLRTYVSNS